MNRVKIREYVLADFDAYADWQSDPEVARHITWLPKNRAQSRDCLADAIAQQTTVPRIRHFLAVVLADTDETIGNVGLTITGPGTGDCGWFLRRHYWGCGYATDAAQLLVEYAFQALGLERLTASCAVGNSASERVMLKCGFVCVERSEGRAKYENQKTDWQQAQQALTADAAAATRNAVKFSCNTIIYGCREARSGNAYRGRYLCL